MTRTLPFAVALLIAAPADAQSASLAGARDALTRYDLGTGSASLAAIGELAPIATGGGSDAAEARALRAIAGAEMWAAAVMLDEAGPIGRVASALGVTSADAAAHLREELGAVRGTYRSAAREALGLLDLLDGLAGDGTALVAASGPRRDAAVAIFAIRHPSAEALAAMGPEATDATASGWDTPSRRALGAVREALAAATRAARAASAGDPLLALLDDRMASLPSALSTLTLRPRIAPPDTSSLALVEGGSEARPDVVVVVRETTIEIGVAPVYRLDASGSLAPLVAGDTLPLMRTVVLPELGPVPQSVDEIVAALGSLTLAEGAAIAIVPSETVQAHVVTRTLLSFARASRTVTHLGGRRADGTLVTIPLRAARDADAGTLDVRARVRLGGYAVSRGTRGRDTTLPRIRDAAGALAFDAAGFSTFLAAGAHGSLALETMATVAGGDVVRAAFLAAASGAAVTWILP